MPKCAAVKPLADDRAQSPAPRAGFALPRDIVIAPARAFAAIKARPEWVPAALIVVILSLAGTVLIAPALAHVTISELTARLAPGTRPSPQAVSEAITEGQVSILFSQTIQQLAAWTLTAMVLTTAARIRGQATSFVTFFALAVNCAVPMALGFALETLIIRLHNPAHYVNWNQLYTAFPLTLAVLDPHGTPAQIGFLSQFDVFFFWTGLLVAYGYIALSGDKLIRALILAFGVGLSLSLLPLLISSQ